MPKLKTESKVKQLRFPGGSVRYPIGTDPGTARMSARFPIAENVSCCR